MERPLILLLSCALLLGAHAQSFHTSLGGAKWQQGVGVRGDAMGTSTLLQDVAGPDGRTVVGMLTAGPAGTDATWHPIALSGNRYAQKSIPWGDGFLLCGSVVHAGRHDHDPFIAHLDAAGTVLWEWTNDLATVEEQLLSLAPDGAGGVIAAGVRRAGGDANGLVVRLAANGSLQWIRHHGTVRDERLEGVAAAGSGFIAVGTTRSAAGDTDAYVLRLDANGEALEWQGWGGIANDGFRAICVTNTGNVVMVGYRSDVVTPAHNRRKHAYLMAMDPEGDTLWTRTYTQPSREYDLWAVSAAENGDVIVGGTTANAGRSEAFVGRYTTSGTVVWQRTYPLRQRDAVVRGITPLSNNGFLATGRSYGGDAGQVLLLLKNANGL